MIRSRTSRWIASGVAAAVLTGLIGGVVGATVGPSLLRGAADAAAARAFAVNEVTAADLNPVLSDRRVIYLVIGSDRRENLPAGTRAVGRLRGQRADSVMLCALGPGLRPALVLSLPRDLRVHVPGHGDQKLGGSYEYGARTLLHAVRAVTGLRVQHVVEVDFAGLSHVVDLLGGVTMDLQYPARDRVAKLSVRAGRQRLDGTEALAYVRSRQYEELRDGRWVSVDASDLGRIGRQHQILAALLSEAGQLSQPAMLRELAREIGRHVSVDHAFGARDVAFLRAAPANSGGHTKLVTLPTVSQQPAAESVSPFPPRHLGNIRFLLPREPEAEATVARFATTAAEPGARDPDE